MQSNVREHLRHWRQAYRNTDTDDIPPENREYLLEVTRQYNTLTGESYTNWNAVLHHWVGLYGPPCKFCGKLLRAPSVTRCFECQTDQPPEYLAAAQAARKSLGADEGTSGEA